MERRIFNRNEVSEKLSSGEYHLKHRKLLRSGVWQHFARVYNGDQPLNYTCCMHCHQVYPYAHKSGTSAMLKHKCVKNFAANNGSIVSMVKSNNASFDDAAAVAEISAGGDVDLNSSLLNNTTSAFAAYINSYSLNGSSLDEGEAAIVVNEEGDDGGGGGVASTSSQNHMDMDEVQNHVSDDIGGSDVGESGAKRIKLLDTDRANGLPFEILPEKSHKILPELKQDRFKANVGIKVDELRDLQKKKLIAEINKINAETEYWRAMTLKVNEESRKVQHPSNP